MNFMKRALLSITRKKGKSLILFLLIFILGNVIAGAISVQQATLKSEQKIKKSMGAVASITIDKEKMEEDATSKIKSLTPEIMRKIGENPRVKYYDFSEGSQVTSRQLEQYHATEGESWDRPPNFSLNGGEQPIFLDLFEKKVEFDTSYGQGRTFTEAELKNGAHVTIMRSELAEVNNIRVGDMVKLANIISENEMRTHEMLDDMNVYASRDLDLEVIGIVKSTKATGPKSGETKKINEYMKNMDEQQKINMFYVSNAITERENDFSREKLAEILDEENLNWLGYKQYTPTYILNEPEDVDAFKIEVAVYLPEFYSIHGTTDSFDSIAGAILTMRALSTSTLYIAIGATLLIMSLIIILFLRDRKHELGIYLSLGESKPKVMSQILSEVLLIAILSMSCALISGNSIAQSVSKGMLENQLSAETEKNDGYRPGYETNMSDEDISASYEIKMDGSYIVLFYGIGIVTIGLSTASSLVYILRLNPKKIML
ncbi:ABC transporter permease [Erysipelotrichaceae bacterium]|nr:ABC transporter permease [Erysipelotrichaceae bacterium]